MILQTCPHYSPHYPGIERDLLNDFNDLGAFRGKKFVRALSHKMKCVSANILAKSAFGPRRRIFYPVIHHVYIFINEINDLRCLIWGTKTGSKTGNRGKS